MENELFARIIVTPKIDKCCPVEDCTSSRTPQVHLAKPQGRTPFKCTQTLERPEIPLKHLERNEVMAATPRVLPRETKRMWFDMMHGD